MKNSEINDAVFYNAVESIDKGNIPALKKLVDENPRLLSERLITSNDGYFKEPYLLYFIADNPIRIDKLPTNIVAITKFLIDELKKNNTVSLQEQLDYTLGLVATGRIPRECHVQIELIDLLIDEGARPGNGLGALAHGNIEAAKHLIRRGGKLSLATAVGVGAEEDILRLTSVADDDEKLVALTVAAFYGKQEMVSMLLATGVDPNAYPGSEGFHRHATPLHQAVSSGSLACVKLLVDAGADPNLEDKIYGGTPLGWTKHMQTEKDVNEQKKNNYASIERFLLKIGTV